MGGGRMQDRLWHHVHAGNAFKVVPGRCGLTQIAKATNAFIAPPVPAPS